MTIPKVFISYSHDSEAHIRWVLDFAKKLRNSGINAIIDQWELSPGDDLPHFMETHLASSDYILMICTKQYIEKANLGIGGVGYEKMIITSDLLKKIDHNKIIPIIKMTGTPNTPTFLRSKIYLDFSLRNYFEKNFDILIRTIHKNPLRVKPKIGNNPFISKKEPLNKKASTCTKYYRNKDKFNNNLNFDSELLTDKTIFSRRNVKVEIHYEYELKLDPVIVTKFNEQNERRKNNGLLEQFAAPCYRLIYPPSLNAHILKLDVAPMNFAHYALLSDSDIERNIKVYISDMIEGVANKTKSEINNTHKYLNFLNSVPLGVEMILITKDEKTLLRRRGKSVATSQYKWDVGFSGYCSHKDLDISGKLQVWKTADTELKDEISEEIPRDPSQIFFLGLHRNLHNMAIDLLGYWKVEINSNDLKTLISNKNPNEKSIIFETINEPDEEFVWDTQNIIVDLDGKKITDTLNLVRSGIGALMPEART